MTNELALIKEVADICGMKRSTWDGHHFWYYDHNDNEVLYYAPSSEYPYRLSALADYVEAYAWAKGAWQCRIFTCVKLSMYNGMRFTSEHEFDPSNPHSKNLAILRAFVEAMRVIKEKK